jgi:hypothetical protein
MAVDVIIRPEGSCLTVAFDMDLPVITAVALRGATLFAIFDDGYELEFGTLTDSMRLGARTCSICVVVRIDGDRVGYSRQVDFMSD